MYRSAKRMFGRDYNDKDASAYFGNNPALQYYYDVQIGGINGTETSGSVAAAVWITYYVWLFEPSVTTTD